MKVYVQWNENGGWEESQHKIKEEELKVGETYFENEDYRLKVNSKEGNEYFLVAEWK